MLNFYLFRPLPEALVCPLADDAVVKSIPIRHFPRDLFMIGRSLMILRGLTHSLGMDVKVRCSACGPLIIVWLSIPELL